MDYKEILREKSLKLEELFYKCFSQLSIKQIKSISTLIDNTSRVIAGKLDNLDNNTRNKFIIEYHYKLDRAIDVLSRFCPVKDNDNVIE